MAFHLAPHGIPRGSTCCRHARRFCCLVACLACCALNSCSRMQWTPGHGALHGGKRWCVAWGQAVVCCMGASGGVSHGGKRVLHHNRMVTILLMLRSSMKFPANAIESSMFSTFQAITESFRHDMCADAWTWWAISCGITTMSPGPSSKSHPEANAASGSCT